MWRPKNWKNPYRDPSYREKFETGADAMLDALKAEGTYTGDKFSNIMGKLIRNRKGWLVFIPDE